METSFEILCVDYEQEECSVYVKRMSLIYPHINFHILSFFWNGLSRDIFKEMFKNINFNNVKTYSRKDSWQNILRCDSLFPDWIEVVSEDPSYRFELYKQTPEIIKSWEEDGTWKTPILVFVPKKVSKSRYKNKIVFEGHTRIGILKGLLINNEIGVKLRAEHEVIYIEEL